MYTSRKPSIAGNFNQHSHIEDGNFNQHSGNINFKMDSSCPIKSGVRSDVESDAESDAEIDVSVSPLN